MARVRVTIYDVAQAAGVSISTVSNALNRPDRVRAATRARVLQIADDLGFMPKAEAVSAARKRMRRIGVVAPFSAYTSYMQRLAGILTEASAGGVEVSVFDHESAATAASPVIAGLPIRGQLDGLIVMGSRVEDLIEQRLLSRGLPTVVVDAQSAGMSIVACDDAAGGAMAAAHLYQLGHRDLGYILEHQVAEYFSQALRRLTGFRTELERRGDCRLTVAEAGSSSESAMLAARTLLTGDRRPTAVMAHYDELAIGVLRVASEMGLSIPGDLSVMGCDDGPAAAAANLTTIRQPLRESGTEAARLLLTMIEQPGHARTVTYLDLTLIERGSTAELPAHLSSRGA